MSTLDKYTKKPELNIDDERKRIDERLRALDEREAMQKQKEELFAKETVLKNREPPKEPEQKKETHLVGNGIRFSKEEVSASTDITPADEKVIMERFMKRNISLGRRERKFVEGREKEGTKERQNVVVYLAIVGIAFISFMFFYVKVEWMSIVLLYVGLMMFLPIGMILGWALLDPYMRCKILRRASHRNYGIVNFVGKGQKIITKIKNFDDALIWKGNAVWAITKEHIYQLTKDGDKLVTTGKIDSENIVSIVDTVPVLFVDLDSMQPLGLARDRREGINPLELGPALKSWIDNEKAKALGLRKTMDMFFIILIILAFVSVGIAYISMNNVNDMMAQFTALQGKIDMLINNTATVVP